MKPVFEEIMKEIVGSQEREDNLFYQRQFRFFENVTAISGSLKPLIKRSRSEKKVAQMHIYMSTANGYPLYYQGSLCICIG